MATINTKRQSALYTKEAHLNWMGGPSYTIGNPIFNLRLAASSCFFGEPQYYHTGGKAAHFGKSRSLSPVELDHLRSTLNAIDPKDWRGLSPQKMMEKAIDNALDYNAEETLQMAAHLRNEDLIRVTPQVILVRASHHPKVKNTGLIRKYAPAIVKRADEPATCIAYHKAVYGNAAIPNSLKRALADVLSSFNDYQLAKYRCEDRKVKTVDVVNLTHPKSTPTLTKLVNGTLKTDNRTWESIRSSGGSWEDALEVMGHMALLRNLRNLVEANIPTEKYLQKLVDGVRDGKQLPFRYYSAYTAVKEINGNPAVLDAIEECLKISFENAPRFNGRIMSLCDNSGSARGTTTSELGKVCISDIANLSAVVTGKLADEGHIGIFGNRLETFGIRKYSSIFDEVKVANSLGGSVGGATEHGIWLFWDSAIKNKEHWDHVFVYSDMQAGHGGLYGNGGYDDYVWGNKLYGNRYIDVPKLINTYRRSVNPNVNVYLVQVAGYQDTIVPEFYNRTYILGGWGSGILKFAASMSQLFDR